MSVTLGLLAAKQWQHPCPECGGAMTGTGTVVHQVDPPAWFVQLWCPVAREVFTLWTSALEAQVTDMIGPP